jgi:hypothetical protein
MQIKLNLKLRKKLNLYGQKFGPCFGRIEETKLKKYYFDPKGTRVALYKMRCLSRKICEDKKDIIYCEKQYLLVIMHNILLSLLFHEAKLQLLIHEAVYFL